MKSLFTLFLLSLSYHISAQTTIDFENHNVDVDTYWNGSDGSGGFNSGNVFFPNSYISGEGWEAWSGWSISSTTDASTPGPGNQYSAITGEGYNQSTSYAVGSAFNPSIFELTGDAAGGVVEGFYITNSTYVYWSLKQGDQFASSFGGETGDDPDFFLLTIKKYLDGEIGSEKIEFYLADYRFEDNNQDYIVDEWTYIDLRPLGNADSLQFTLTSSDTGAAGMNTPAYFCIDNLTTQDAITNTNHLNPVFNYQIYPNPATDFLQIDWQENRAASLSITDLTGKVLKTAILQQGPNQIPVYHLPNGSYIVELEFEKQRQAQLFLKTK